MSEIYSYYSEAGIRPFRADAQADCDSMVIPCCFYLYEKPDTTRWKTFVGSVKGFLILGQEIERRKPCDFLDSDVFMNLICDDAAADLGFVVSALLKNAGPLSIDRSLDGMNHFHIDEVTVQRPELLPEILHELPEMVFRHLHVFPEVLSYYPKPLSHESEPPEIEDVPLSFLLNDALVYLVICDDAASEYALTPEQLARLREMHENATSYPAEYIDRALWQPFLEAGFTEHENTRVLYKTT